MTGVSKIQLDEIISINTYSNLSAKQALVQYKKDLNIGDEMVNGKEIFVIKRNGRGREPLNIDKIHEMVEYACEDISGVSSSLVEMNSGLQFYDNIPTDQIQQILIRSLQI